jgi:hypothetical protein
MMEKMAKRPLVYLVTVAAACGAADHQLATPPSSSTRLGSDGSGSSEPSRHLTPGQLKVAHFATRDGMIGLVLDRTMQPPKLRMDGEQAVIELGMEEDRNGDVRAGWIFRAPDGHIVLYLAADGNFKVFTSTDVWGIELTNDRSAEPLPQATVRISAALPETDSGIMALAALATRKRFPQFKPEDSANLTKVAEALALATSDMLVHTTDIGAQQARWAPATNHIKDEVRGESGAFRGLLQSNETWDKTRPGLAKYGLALEGAPLRFGVPSRLEPRALKGWSPALATHTPGIIWETDPVLVFVTVDGGRYELDRDPAAVEKGWPPSASWPPALQHAALDVASIDLLAADGAVAEQVKRELDVLADAWLDCVNDLWRAAKPKIDALGAAGLSADVALAHEQSIRHAAEQSVGSKCGSLVKQCEVGLVRVIENRNVERLTILDKARARAK